MDIPDHSSRSDDHDSLRARIRLLELVEGLMHDLLPAVKIWHREDPADNARLRLVYSYTNPNMPNMPYDDTPGRLIREVIPHIPDFLLQQYATVIESGTSFTMSEADVIMPDGSHALVSLRAMRLAPDYLAVIHEDITDRKRAEVAQQQLREQQAIIERQQESLLELSTPLIPITDQVMVMPLIGAIDSRRAQQIIQTLLEGIASRGVTVVILDITGVPIVDTQVANALIQAAQSVKLLGAQVVLTGIRPEVAQTLVGLGIDLRGILTMSTLQAGIAHATSEF